MAQFLATLESAGITIYVFAHPTYMLKWHRHIWQSECCPWPMKRVTWLQCICSALFHIPQNPHATIQLLLFSLVYIPLWSSYPSLHHFSHSSHLIGSFSILLSVLFLTHLMLDSHQGFELIFCTHPVLCPLFYTSASLCMAQFPATLKSTGITIYVFAHPTYMLEWHRTESWIFLMGRSS